MNLEELRIRGSGIRDLFQQKQRLIKAKTKQKRSQNRARAKMAECALGLLLPGDF
jgi:hypothetical protein